MKYRKEWSKEEDELLTQAVEHHSHDIKWNEISYWLLGKNVNRNGVQCKMR